MRREISIATSVSFRHPKIIIHFESNMHNSCDIAKAEENSMANFLPLSEAVAQNLKSGDMVAFEGFTHLIPHASAHEAIRQNVKDLTLVRMTPDVIYDQLIGIGAVRKLIFSYAGNPGVGLLRRLRDAVENGWPNRIEIEEHSHAAMANAYEAGAAGLPFAMFRGYKGAELARVNPNIRTVTCPFTGEELAAVPAIRPDVTFIHAQKADRKGNVLIEGIVGVQKEAVLAAKRAVVTVEDLVDDLHAHPNACVLPSWTVSAISVVPGGAHPSYAHGYYPRDNASYIAWDKIAADRETFLDWMKQNVLDASPEDFAARTKHLRSAA
jgi:glutaconate CoA-transferase subunit A